MKSIKIPGISDHLQVVADEQGLIVSAEGRIHALDPGDYSERWAIQSPQRWGGYRALRFVSGMLIAGTELKGQKICGLDPQTGRTLWEMPSPLGRADVLGSDLLVPVPDKPEALVVDALSGRILERIELPGTWGAVFGEIQVFRGKDATLTGFDLATRKTLWQRTYTPTKGEDSRFEDRVLGGSVEAGIVVFRQGPELLGLRLRTGETAWQAPFKANASFFRDLAVVEAPPAEPSRNPMVDACVATCIELRTGRVRWARPNAELGWPIMLAQVHALGDDFVLGTYGRLVVLSAADGRTVLEAQKPKTALLGGTWRSYLFVCGERGRFDALEASVVGDATPKRRGKSAARPERKG